MPTVENLAAAVQKDALMAGEGGSTFSGSRRVAVSEDRE
jgi:hypothetical protein